MKTLCVVGTRPQFIKHKILGDKLKEKGHEVVLVHTGQHYDASMSDIFFKDLDIPNPNYNLDIKSGTHCYQIGHGIVGIEKILQVERPDVTLVYGDCNSTLSGAIASRKLAIPVVHAEAGLRCYDEVLPEELNRKLVDHCSSLLLCPTNLSVLNLKEEGLDGKFVGDLRYDALKRFIGQASRDKISEKAGMNFHLCTLHRPRNVDKKERLQGIMDELAKLDWTVVLPCHPRTLKNIQDFGIKHENVQIIKPVGYIEMLSLLKHCRSVWTDSGGLMVESYLLNKKCKILREKIEYPEIDRYCGNNIFGDGKSADKMVKIMEAEYR